MKTLLVALGIIIAIVVIPYLTNKLKEFITTDEKLIYKKLLQDPNWKAKRIKILNRDNYCCRYCGSTKYLKVHHKYYSRYPNGDKVYVISASITEWVSPWCFAQGITHVLCTDVEVTDSLKLTGRFRTKNCYGQEKVNRLLEIESDRHSYWLIAYGDSKGDREMLSFADEGHLIT